MSLDKRSQAAMLLPYQQQWVRDTSQIKLIVKSRRIGISWAEAAGSVAIASGTTGQSIWYVSYNELQAQQFIEDCAWWAMRLNQIAQRFSSEKVYKRDEEKSTRVFGIEFASGHRITALSSNPANLRGKQGIVVIDEAAFIPNLPELLKAAIALTIWGGSIHIISTYNGTNEPFYRLVQDTITGSRDYSLHGPVTFDDAIAQGLYERICQMNGSSWSAEGQQKWRDRIVADYGEDADEELFCIPRSPSVDYFPSLLVESCMSDSYTLLSYECDESFNMRSDNSRLTETRLWLQQIVQPLLKGIDRNFKSFIGFDFGRHADLSVICPIIETPQLNRIVPFIVQMRTVPIKQQEQVLDFIIEGLPRFSHGSFDAGGNGLVMAEFAQQRYGKNAIEQVYLQPKVYGEIGPLLKSALEERTITLPKHADILADLSAVKLEKGFPKVPDRLRYKGSDGKSRHGDAFVAIALAYRSAKKKGNHQVSQFRHQIMPPPDKPTFTQRDAILKDFELTKMAKDSEIRGLFGA